MAICRIFFFINAYRARTTYKAANETLAGAIESPCLPQPISWMNTFYINETYKVFYLVLVRYSYFYCV